MLDDNNLLNLCLADPRQPQKGSYMQIMAQTEARHVLHKLYTTSDTCVYHIIVVHELLHVLTRTHVAYSKICSGAYWTLSHNSQGSSYIAMHMYFAQLQFSALIWY